MAAGRRVQCSRTLVLKCLLAFATVPLLFHIFAVTVRPKPASLSAAEDEPAVLELFEEEPPSEMLMQLERQAYPVNDQGRAVEGDTSQNIMAREVIEEEVNELEPANAAGNSPDIRVASIAPTPGIIVIRGRAKGPRRKPVQKSVLHEEQFPVENLPPIEFRDDGRHEKEMVQRLIQKSDVGQARDSNQALLKVSRHAQALRLGNPHDLPRRLPQLPRRDNSNQPAETTGDQRFKFPCYGDKSAQWLHHCPKTCHSTSAEVPNIVHFILLDAEFGFMFWLAVRSAIVYAKPERIQIYTTMSKKSLHTQNCWLRRVVEDKPLVHVTYLSWTNFPSRIRNYKIRNLAHFSDWLRLAVLWEQGGIYMDTDAILVKPLDPLMYSHAVVSRQATGRPGNGMFVVRPNSCFVCRYSRVACKNFDGRWATHSSVTLDQLFGRKRLVRPRHVLLENVRVLEWKTGFFPFSWTKNGLYNLFARPMSTFMRDDTEMFAVHLYNKVSKEYQKNITYDYIQANPSLLAGLIRHILPKSFTRATLEEEQCTKDSPVP